MSVEAHTKYQRLLDLETDTNPDRIFEAMVDERLAKLEAKKRGKLRKAAKAETPAPVRGAAPISEAGPAPRNVASKETRERVGPKDNPRYVDAATKRAVYERDSGQCQFRAESGRKCLSTRNTHLHHVRNFAEGGPTTIENLEVRCACHNLYQGWLDFGGGEPALHLGSRGA